MISGDTPRPDGAPAFERLSPRQREIIELIARGLSNDDIAGVLRISTATVRTHVSQLLLALGVDNRTEAAALYSAWSQQPERTATVLARPAIAVTPFAVLDDDPRLRTVAAGLRYDLATLFARWCWFPVVFDPLAEGGEARFRVAGALRRHGGQLRLTARVDDGDGGGCLWTGHHDLGPDLFAVEDEVCGAVVGAAYPVLVAHALAVAEHPPAQPGDLPAWELAHHAMVRQLEREARANADAQAGFSAALTRDPRLVLAHFGLGLASYDALLHQWSEREAALGRLAACADRCLTLAPHAAEGYFLTARHHQARGEHALATGPLELAIRHNPSFAPAHALLAQVLVLQGRIDDGLVCARRATQLSPRTQGAGLAVVHFVCGQYPEALAAAEQAMQLNPAYPFARALAAASAHWLGDRSRATQHHQALRRLAPTFTPGRFRDGFGRGIPGVDRLGEALEILDGGGPVRLVR